MCSRYSRTKGQAKVGRRRIVISSSPQGLIRPTDRAVVLRQGAEGIEESTLRWGLVPSWAKDMAIGVRCLNARAETLFEKPAFKEAFQKRRCLVPADGFWEWEKIGSRKVPWKFTRPDGEEFLMAGLWDRWMGGGEPLESFTIITTTPNGVVGEVHNRMPVILTAEDGAAWLEQGSAGLCRPVADDFLFKAGEPLPAVEEGQKEFPF